VVLSHLGEDPNATGVDSHELVRRTTGIDILFDGHTHSVIPHDTVLNACGKPVVVSETGTKFKHIGKVLIRDGKMTNELIPVQTLSERSVSVQAVTDSIEILMREQTQRVVCHSDVRLRILNDKGGQEVRLAETNTGDLICDAYRIISGADIALANGGGIRAEKIAGDLTYGDITDMLPYDNHLWVVEATGATITELLRMNTSFIPVEDGSFPQVSGVRFTVHTADKTVSNVEVLNKKSGQYEPIDPEKTYTVATIDYCVTGGGFREMLKNCKVIERGEVLYRDVFVQFLEKNLGGRISNDYANPQGRITIIQ
jgi:2',3'-cyclic-nucleotide 2'-phosphodiesterase (5'-nucleotidase family)